MRRLRPGHRTAFGILAALMVVLVFVGAANARQNSTIGFSFQGYANNVRVRAPLVGAWQLGTARINGSGKLTSTTLDGTFTVANDPLYSRYAPSVLRARVIGYAYYQAAHSAFTRLTLTVEVTSSSHPEKECAIGARGKLTLYDSAEKLENGMRTDSITLNWPGVRCPGHVQGWTNDDGGARTRPTFGGPPNGGQWAVVRIAV